MIYLLSILFILNPANATDCTQNSQKIKNLKEVCNVLEPKCIEEGVNFKGSEKAVTVIKNLTKDSSDDELFTRLIFSEALASTCVPGKDENKIMEGISWTLANRVAANKPGNYGTGRGVVTQPSQFSSSTGPCEVAKRKEFLCPQKLGPKWHETWEKASQAWAKTKKEKNPMPTVRHYFFPNHFNNSKDPSCLKWKGKSPSWATPQNKVSEVPSCVTFHNVKE
jgi:hypothetical protein